MITHDGKDYHVLMNIEETVSAYRITEFNFVEFYTNINDDIRLQRVHIYDIEKMLENHKQLKFETLTHNLAEKMEQHAEDHWKDYVWEDTITIDAEGELERAYEALNGRTLPTDMYEPLLASKIITDAVEAMHDTIKTRMGEYEPPPRTMAEKLREVGMSERDFM